MARPVSRPSEVFVPWGRLLQSCGISIVLMLILAAGLTGQVRPVDGLHQYTPRVYALTNAAIHLEPGKVVKGGTVLLRDGLIEAAGRQVNIPADATVISLEGKSIYPGFIESYWEVAPDKGDRGTDAAPPGPESGITSHWSERIRPSQSVFPGLKPDSSDLVGLRKLGFTTAHLVPARGIFRGPTAVIQLTDWGPEASLSENIAQALAFDYGSRQDREYPSSLLGSIALIRQTILDAQWYARAWDTYRRYPQFNEHPEVNDDLAALTQTIAENKPFLFTTDDELASLRAGEIAAEFGLPLWVAGNGYEYRRLKALKKLNAFFIIPVNFPKAPEVATLEDELQVSLETLRHWDQAPDNPQRLQRAGIPFALTSGKLKDRSRFKDCLARSVERGFDAKQALAALTTIPAERLGLSASYGKIAKGYVANLVVTDGGYFSRDSRVIAVWIDGKEYQLEPEPVEDFRGEWELGFPIEGEASASYSLQVEGKVGSPRGRLEWDKASVSLNELKLRGSFVSWTIPADSIGREGVWRFSGNILGDAATGTGIRADGSSFTWSATRSSTYTDSQDEEAEKKTPEEASRLQPLYPEGAFGRPEQPEQPAYVLVRNATIWTSGREGIVKEGDLLIERGKISAVGRSLTVPRRARKSLVEIDGTGKHVTPGLIDAHSHTAEASVNEGTQAITAEVRIRDVIDSDAIAIYRELAGGLTMANLLHGSANPIGGHNAVIKLRWGATPQELIDKRASQGIKFALGENVKRSNWSDAVITRYPTTRMGVDQIIRDAFRAAQDYQREWETYSASKTLKTTRIPPRRDLELEALVEVLEGKREVHAHSYRQDEILNLIRIADDFGFTIGTLQHVLEGYKVAPEIAKHGAGASCFSDWWAYKFEVYDAIPYNGALMAQAGVVISFNSDSDELARRLYTEAAKAVKYGGLSEEDALNLVTINPARQLKVDRYVGSLEPGKDGDFVIWNGHPLSTYSRCEQTWIDGHKYFDLAEDLVMRNQQQAERAQLIQKALSETIPPKASSKAGKARDNRQIRNNNNIRYSAREVRP
ncbi:MAG: amidohydrolase family protein [Calditrichaeota bacterium]|nr:amidohydrolase family protein [Calditrichota bacterium]